MHAHDLPHEHSEPAHLSCIIDKLENLSDFQLLASIFKQLGDPSRLRIFWLLCHCEECVSNIAALLSMSAPAVCHHLRILKDNSLITGRRDGKEVIYTASDSQQSRLLHHMIERSMQISCPVQEAPHAHLVLPDEHSSDQLSLIRSVHEYLLSHIDQKITIEELAQRFAINTTSLKSLFKSVYGTSLAAHIKQHRLQMAAGLLTDTDLPIAQIAARVGYESQSRFSASFKEHYRVLPSKYRADHQAP